MIPNIPIPQIWKPNYGLQGYFPQGSVGEGAPSTNFVVVGCANGTALTASGSSQNILFTIPHIFSKEVTIASVNIRVTTLQAGTNARIGIYTNKSKSIPFPDKLIFDSGSIATTSTGVKTVACGITLEPGLYWFATNTSGATTATFRAIAVGGVTASGFMPTALGTWVSSGWATAFTFGAMPYMYPNSAPTGLFISTIAIGLALQYDTR